MTTESDHNQRAKAEWKKPELRRLAAGAAEDNPGTGSDANGRLS
jgi:hypothetical protein